MLQPATRIEPGGASLRPESCTGIFRNRARKSDWESPDSSAGAP